MKTKLNLTIIFLFCSVCLFAQFRHQGSDVSIRIGADQYAPTGRLYTSSDRRLKTNITAVGILSIKYLELPPIIIEALKEYLNTIDRIKIQ